MWVCGYVAMWLYDYVAMWLSGSLGEPPQGYGEPPARASLTDLSSELLEPQGKLGWGNNHYSFPEIIKNHEKPL